MTRHLATNICCPLINAAALSFLKRTRGMRDAEGVVLKYYRAQEHRHMVLYLCFNCVNTSLSYYMYKLLPIPNETDTGIYGEFTIKNV